MSFNEKKIEKDSDDFWHRKLTLKVKFQHFLTPSHYTNLQNSMISFDCSWFVAKNLSNFISLPWTFHNRYCHNMHIWHSKQFFTIYNKAVGPTCISKSKVLIWNLDGWIGLSQKQLKWFQNSFLWGFPMIIKNILNNTYIVLW